MKISVALVLALLVGIVASQGNIRLANGRNSDEGRIEVHRNGQWGVLCDSGFNYNAAQVVCRQLGKTSDYAVPMDTSYFGSGSPAFQLSGFTCSGTESSINGCSGLTGTSRQCQNAGVICRDTNSTVLRLAVGYQSRLHLDHGRVEIFYGNEWGTICDDGWSDRDAQVACSMLGFSSDDARSVIRAAYGLGSGPILLDDVYCNGTEDSIVDCRHRPWRMENCLHSEDAGIDCNATYNTLPTTGPFLSTSIRPVTNVQIRLAGSSYSNEGRVEIYVNNQWGTVCDDSFGNNEARVICGMLNFTQDGSRATSISRYGPGSYFYPIWLDDLNCAGNETNIMECGHQRWGRHNCGHSEDAAVICNRDNSTDPRYLSVRLVNGSSQYEGRVEVNIGGEWGTVCDDQWGYMEARVVCRMLGLPTSNVIYRTYGYFGRGTGRILLDNVDCSGSESNLGACRHNHVGVNDCTHSEDAGVSCFSRGLTCYHCDGLEDSSRCYSRITCGYGEACYQVSYMIGSRRLHTMGCKSQLECDGTTPGSVGKRDTGVNSKCCASSNCNRNLFNYPTSDPFATTVSPSCIDEVPAGMSCASLMSTMNVCGNRALARSYCRRSCGIC